MTTDSIVEKLNAGAKPTDLLRSILSEHPEYTNHDLAREFCDDLTCPDILDVIQPIWYWDRPERPRTGGGLSDDELNAILLRCLFQPDNQKPE